MRTFITLSSLNIALHGLVTNQTGWPTYKEQSHKVPPRSYADSVSYSSTLHVHDSFTVSVGVRFLS